MANLSEKFCLKWNDFQQNMVNSFSDLRTDAKFSDVTLVCDDAQQVEAHRIILMSSSPFFSKVLSKTKHSHPMIFMRGLKATDLMAIVDFIYNGEANIYQEDLDGFLAVAEDLQLKGLARSHSDNHETIENPKEVNNKDTELQFEKYLPNVQDMNMDPVLTEFKNDILDTNTLVKVDTPMMLSEDFTKEDLEAKKISLMEKLEDGRWRCTICEKAAKLRSDIKRHIETHMEGLSYPCNQCGKISRSSHALQSHVSSYHRL